MCTASGYESYRHVDDTYEICKMLTNTTCLSQSTETVSDPLMKSTRLNSACQVNFIDEHNHLLIALNRSPGLPLECATFLRMREMKRAKDAVSNNIVAIKNENIRQTLWM